MNDAHLSYILRVHLVVILPCAYVCMSVTRMRASVSVYGTRRVSTVVRLVGMLWCSPARRWTPYRTQGLDFRATLRKRRQRARVAASDETAEGARKAEKRFTRARHMSAHSAYT